MRKSGLILAVLCLTSLLAGCAGTQHTHKRQPGGACVG